MTTQTSFCVWKADYSLQPRHFWACSWVLKLGAEQLDLPAIPQHPVGLSPLLVCGSAPVRPPQEATRCCRTPLGLQHCPPRTTRDPDDGFTGWGEPREVGGQAETGTKSWHRAGGRVRAAHAGFGGAWWWWCEFRAVWAAQSDWNSSFQTCPHILLLSLHPFGFCKMESKPNSTKQNISPTIVEINPRRSSGGNPSPESTSTSPA